MKLVKVTVDGKEYYKKVDSDTQDSAEEVGKSKNEHRIRELLAVAEKIGRETAAVVQTFVGAAAERVASLRQTDEKKADEIGELVKLLPYLPPEKMHEACLALESEKNLWKKVEIEAILPYVTPEDCDRLFLSYLNSGNRSFRPRAVLPYIGEKCLSEVLDGVLAGRYSGLSAETLYPYLSKKDLCRLLSLYRKNGGQP